jgi:hypothetical protein
MTQPGDARPANRAPAPSPQLRRLGALVGRRRTEDHIVGDPAVPIAGTGLRVACWRLLPAARAVEWGCWTLIQARSDGRAGASDAETKRPRWTP